MQTYRTNCHLTIPCSLVLRSIQLLRDSHEISNPFQALSADISKMYRAVHLEPYDRDLHHILWREKPIEPLVDFRMSLVTFAVSASPYLTIKTLQQTAQDFGDQFPIASRLIMNSFYIDDLLTGAETPEQALSMHKELRALLFKGNFDLKKWRSSSTSVLNPIDPSLL